MTPAVALAGDGGEVAPRQPEALRQKGPPDLLVNCARGSLAGAFAALPVGGQRELIALHCDTVVTLCRAAVPFMLERGRGAIINLSCPESLSAGGSSVAAATGAFLNRFSLGLQAELADAGIRLQALCVPAGEPGDAVQATALVEASLAALDGGEVVFTPDIQA